MAGGGGEETNLEFTPTWIVALVCSFIVSISLIVERIIHYAGKYLLKKKQKPLYEALQKIKEELMLLGFISLLLTVFQERILKICIPKHLTNEWLPCSKDGKDVKTTVHLQTNFFSLLPGGRRLLAESANSGYCEAKDKAPLLSLTALHHLHTFIFVLAVSHVTFSALTMLVGGIKIRQWKAWEDSIQKEEYDTEEVLRSKVTHVPDHDFVKGRFLGFGKRSSILSWLHSFVKQFSVSVTKSDYATLRLGFIMAHCKGNPKFNFHNYMMRVLEADFKKVVGISWYLWVFVVLFLFLNVHGWHTYFWIAFVPFVLLLAVGTKLQHVITQLAGDVAAKHVAVEGELVVKPSDDHFWFHKPRLVLFLIHIILFQNSFEIAFFFWIWAQYHFNSCIMGQVVYIIPRLVIGVFVQFLCSYSTLPLYAIVTQMGSSFKKEIFDDHIKDGIVFWAKKAKWRAANGSTQVANKESPSLVAVQLSQVETQESAMEEGNAGEISHATNQSNSKVN